MSIPRATVILRLRARPLPPTFGLVPVDRAAVPAFFALKSVMEEAAASSAASRSSSSLCLAPLFDRTCLASLSLSIRASSASFAAESTSLLPSDLSR